jgi:hypothetical protein
MLPHLIAPAAADTADKAVIRGDKCDRRNRPFVHASLAQSNDRTWLIADSPLGQRVLKPTDRSTLQPPPAVAK